MLFSNTKSMQMIKRFSKTERRYCMNQRGFNDFLKSIGLVNYPFNLYTAENEQEYADKLFVRADNYDSIKSSFEGNRSIIVRGNRGIGKTALLLDLQRGANSKAHFVCMIDDYSMLNIEPKIEEYYNLIIRNIAACLFEYLIGNTEKLKKLNWNERIFLSMILSQYTTSTTKNILAQKIEAIQLSKTKKIIKKYINLFRFIFNYGLTTGLNIVNDVLRNYYTLLPPIKEDQIRNFLPTVNLDTDTEFERIDASYNLIIQLCDILKKIGYSRITIVLDKFDEDGKMKNNAETVSKFLVPILTDNKLLENPNIQLIISVWEIPFKRILTEVRTQKHFCPLLLWTTVSLEKALNQRLLVFSDGKIKNYKFIFDNEVQSESIAKIFELSNGNPRDLWHVLNSIFLKQYEMDPNSNKISENAIRIGIVDFVKGFNFYEYYPRNPKSKSNSMDIYSYIKHLLKLTTIEFTKNQMNTQANTGSSTNNYVVGMENIGLVVNTGEKNNGGVLYKINDPKVI